MKILIVDDIGFMRILVGRLVQDVGHEAIPASSGPEAIQQLKCNPDIHIVVADLLMPEMSGTELFEATRGMLRRDEEGFEFPPQFILLTSCRDAKQLQEAQEQGFVDVLVKPVDGTRLAEAINRAVEKIDTDKARFHAGIDPEEARKKYADTLKHLIHISTHSQNPEIVEILREELARAQEEVRKWLAENPPLPAAAEA